MKKAVSFTDCRANPAKLSCFDLHCCYWLEKKNHFLLFFISTLLTSFILSFLLLQHRGRVRAGGRRRGELQDLLHPSQTREGPGGGGDHNPPETGNKTRDLGGTSRQQLNADPGRGLGQGGREGRYGGNWEGWKG